MPPANTSWVGREIWLDTVNTHRARISVATTPQSEQVDLRKRCDQHLSNYTHLVCCDRPVLDLRLAWFDRVAIGFSFAWRGANTGSIPARESEHRAWLSIATYF